MKDKIMSFIEIDTYNRNLRMLEGRLGYKVPVYLLNNDDMCKEIMSFSEIDTTARNIESIMGVRKYPPAGSISYYICKAIEGFYFLFGIVVLIMTVIEMVKMLFF